MSIWPKRPFHFWKFGQRVQNFLTVTGSLCTNVGVDSPVSIQLLTIDGLNILLSIYLANLLLLRIVVHGWVGACYRPIFLLPLFLWGRLHLGSNAQ